MPQQPKLMPSSGHGVRKPSLKDGLARQVLKRMVITQWFCWSLSLLNGYNWEYTLFSDTPICFSLVCGWNRILLTIWTKKKLTAQQTFSSSTFAYKTCLVKLWEHIGGTSNQPRRNGTPSEPSGGQLVNVAAEHFSVAKPTQSWCGCGILIVCRSSPKLLFQSR